MGTYAMNARRQATTWASACLPGYDTATLSRALASVRTHPDAESRGYSIAKQARERLEAELTTRNAA